VDDITHATSFWLNKDVAEEHLLREIAYYKARLADIEKAPRHSRHREGWGLTANRLQECRTKLAKLRSSKRRVQSH
jgi:hypothetical protein